MLLKSLKAQKGFALILVLIAATVLTFVAAIGFRTQKIEQNVAQNLSGKLKKEGLNQTLTRIFEASQLCTCNFKGLKVPITRPGLPPEFGDVVIDQKGQRKQIRKFGFYKLQASGNPCGVIADDQVVMTNGPTDNLPQAVRPEQIRLTNFVYQGVSPTNSTVNRFSSKFVFSLKDQAGKTVTNLQKAISLDLYFEINNQREIVSCYNPNIIIGGRGDGGSAPQRTGSGESSTGGEPTGPCTGGRGGTWTVKSDESCRDYCDFDRAGDCVDCFLKWELGGLNQCPDKFQKPGEPCPRSQCNDFCRAINGRNSTRFFVLQCI